MRLLKAGKHADKWEAYNISFLKFKLSNREFSNLEGPGDMSVSHSAEFYLPSGSSLLWTQDFSPEEPTKNCSSTLSVTYLYANLIIPTALIFPHKRNKNSTFTELHKEN